MGSHYRSSRRDFLKTAGAGLAVPYIITSTALGAGDTPPASERIVMGGIGIGNMGRGDQGAFLGRGDVQYVAVCDVRKDVRDAAKDRVDEHYKNSDCKAYNDFRELLARTDIDAVHIATPDHWHAIIVIEACRNGKDVYCQKPETLTLPRRPADGRGRAALRPRRLRRQPARAGGLSRAWSTSAGAARLGTIKSINVNVGPLSQPCNLPAEAGARRHGLGHVARPGALGALQHGTAATATSAPAAAAGARTATTPAAA